MAPPGNEWAGQWVAKKLRGHTHVASVTLVSPDIVQVVRKEHSTILVGTLAQERVDVAALKTFLTESAKVVFVVNVPKEAYVTGDALELAATHCIVVGGFGDLLRALQLSDVRQYVNPEVGFLERGLAQHSRVESFQRLDDRRYLLSRRDFTALMVVFLNEYELTADHLRTARVRYGPFQMVVITNPNGRATSSADATATALSCRIYKWGEFLGGLEQAMKIDDFITRVRAEAAPIANHVADAVWYVFGSMLFDDASAADMDVLIVYSGEKDAVVIRRALAELCLSLPVHLLLLSQDEERELNFVSTQGCVWIFPERAAGA